MFMYCRHSFYFAILNSFGIQQRKPICSLSILYSSDAFTVQSASKQHLSTRRNTKKLINILVF